MQAKTITEYCAIIDDALLSENFSEYDKCIFEMLTFTKRNVSKILSDYQKFNK